MRDLRPGADPLSQYVLGHSDREIERLKAQAPLIDPITARFLREAEIGPGMRVLDIGSGAGDVAFLAAELVGEGAKWSAWIGFLPRSKARRSERLVACVRGGAQ